MMASLMEPHPAIEEMNEKFDEVLAKAKDERVNWSDDERVQKDSSDQRLSESKGDGGSDHRSDGVDRLQVSLESGDAYQSVDPIKKTSREVTPSKSVKSQRDDEELDSEGWLDLLGTGRIRKRVLEAGDPTKGGRPRQGAAVTISLTVFFQEMEAVPEHEVFFFSGESEVMQAIDLVVPVMNWGELAEVVADPEFTYGKLGLPESRIPPNASVRLVMRLLNASSGPIDLTELTVGQKMAHGRRKKDRGNMWYAREEYRFAVQCYRKAVEFFDDEQLELDVPVDRFSLSEELQELLVERIKTYNNLAQCQMKIESYDAAFISLKQVLKIDPNNEKALYRKSKVLQEKLCSEEAIGILRRIQRLYPENKLARADLAKLTVKQKKNRQAEERLSKKMLGLDKYEDEKKSSNRSRYWKNFAITSTLVVGGIGAMLGAVAAAFKMRGWM